MDSALPEGIIMSDGINKFFGVGNLAADPEYRMTQGGQGVLNFRLACSDRYKDREGQWQERVEYVSCTLWGSRGEALARILCKGMGVTVMGSLRTRSYEKDGQKRYSTSIHVDELVIGSRRRPSPEDAASLPDEPRRKRASKQEPMREDDGGPPPFADDGYGLPPPEPRRIDDDDNPPPDGDPPF